MNRFYHKEISFKCIRLDDSEESILWLKLSAYECDFTMYVCAMYLLPVDTTGYVNTNAFYEVLLSQILTYQDECDLFYLCGDINGCCGDLPDYIEGMDPIPDRTIIDTAVNKYGELLCEFLLSTDCSILIGRNTSRNYYTFRDISVVDYYLLPHHKLDLFSEFSVQRTLDMFQNTGLLGAIGDQHHILLDHNLLMWTPDISAHLPALSLTEQNGQSIPTTKFVKYDCSEIPETFMLNDPIVVQIQSCIQRIETAVYNQSVIDEEYEQFCKVVQREMDEKLVHRTLKVKCGLSNMCRRIKKPYWNDRLTELWNDLITTQRAADRIRGTQKAHLTAEARGKQIAFDRVYQPIKRQYWHKMQNDILPLQQQIQRNIGNMLA